MENPIFVVGLPRSGSTLLENIIARNPDIFRLAEVLYLTPWRKDFRYFIRNVIGDLKKDENVRKMVDVIFTPHDTIPGLTGSFWRFENIKAFNEDILKKRICDKIFESDRSLGNIFRILIKEITYYNGYRRCCVAFPVYPSHVHELLQWFPQSKIIHNTRDPRAIAISKTSDPSGAAQMIKRHPRFKFAIKHMMIFFVIVQYIWTSKLHCRFKGIDNYKLFRYEDLVANPEATIKRLCKFAEIDFVQKMLEPKEGMESSVTKKTYKGINKELATKWQNIISPLQEKIITFLTKRSMRRLNYDWKQQLVFFKE